MDEHSFDERRKNIDENCEIAKSDLCSWLATNNGCSFCYIKSLKNEHQKKEALSRWKETLLLLPEDIDALHLNNECCFCKEEPQKADGYAFVEMAHIEPYYEKGIILGYGKKVRSEVGSLLAVQCSICNSCKNKIILAESLPLIIPLLFVIVAIIALIIPPLGAWFSNAGEFIPLLFLISMIAIGYFGGRFVRERYISKLSKSVKINLADIPKFNKMLAKGWFAFQSSDGMPKLSYSKSRKYDWLKKPLVDN